MNEDEIKSMAKRAKKRMQKGFWRDYRENVEDVVDSVGVCSSEKSEAVRYFRAKAERALDGMEGDEFYLKVKRLLDTVGDASDIIGRLAEPEKMCSMSFQEKQRYLFELSAKYRSCRERYEQEKRFENVSLERKNA